MEQGAARRRRRVKRPRVRSVFPPQSPGRDLRRRRCRAIRAVFHTTFTTLPTRGFDLATVGCSRRSPAQLPGPELVTRSSRFARCQARHNTRTCAWRGGMSSAASAVRGSGFPLDGRRGPAARFLTGDVCGWLLRVARIGPPRGTRNRSSVTKCTIVRSIEAHGAPLRLQMPTKLGYKQAKYLITLEVSHVLPAATQLLGRQGYSWYAGRLTA